MENYSSFCVNIKKITVAHEFVLNKSSSHSCLNGRKYCGIIYCTDGEAEFIFSSKKREKKGNIILLSPESAYSVIVKNEFRHCTINFETEGSFPPADFSDDEFYLFEPENTEIYRHNFKKAARYWQSKNIGFELHTMACLYELSAMLLSEIYERRYSTRSYLRLQPAKRYIESNFKKSITLDELANLSDMSVSSFRREWLKCYNESAMKYRDKIRLSHAEEYLLSGYYTVSEVAERCGFDDVNYFVRFFKKHMGVSPGKYAETVAPI